MSTTVSKIIQNLMDTDGAKLTSFKAGAYKLLRGTFGIVGPLGYVYPYGTSGITVKKVVLIAEEVDNSGGSAGDLSVKCYEAGRFNVKATGAALINTGSVAWVSDNETVSPAGAAGNVPCGVISRYISATEVELDLNGVGTNGVITVTKALTAAADGTAGAVLAMLNPLGVDCNVENVILKVTTAPTDTAGGVDVGIAANATTSNDTLIDGKVLAAAGYFSCHNSAGSNGGADRKLAAGQYITATSVVSSHLDLAALVGYAVITLRVI